MAYYEHVLIARQDVNASQVEAITNELTQAIEDQGGRVAKNEYWGLRTLAYKIKKNRKGHYVLLNLDAPHAAVSELERKARLHEDVIRFLTLRVDELEEGPSVFMRSKSDKGERKARRER